MEVYKEKWMSLEPAWGNCGETAWKSNMNGKRKGKKRKTESTEQRAHKRETATSHSFTKGNVQTDKK